MSHFRPPSTVAEAQMILQHLQLPRLQPDALATIGRTEGDLFKQAITDLANEEPGADKHRPYVGAVITACVPNTKAIIEALGVPVPPLSDLIEISKQEGRVFANTIRCLARNEEGADIEAMKTYLRQVLAQIQGGAVPAPSQPRAQQQPPARQQAAPTAGPEQPQLPRDSGAARVVPIQGQQRSPGARQSEHPNAPRSDNNQGRAASTNVREFERRPAPPERDTRNQGGEEDQRRFENVHAYGGKAALCFSADTTRKDARPTVRIEGAPATAPRSYDWNKKVSLQLTVTELPLVFGVLYGFLDRVELTGHGYENEKSFKIENQGDKFFMNLSVRGGGVFAVPVPPKDTYPIMTMMLNQMVQDSRDLPSQYLLMLIKRVCEMHSQGASRPQQRVAAGGA